MRLSKVRFAGYKAFPRREGQDPFELRIEPLTLIFGKNNSGKSAAACLPHHVLGAIASEGREVLPLTVRGRRYGSRWLDLVYGHQVVTLPQLGLTAESSTGHETLELDLSYRVFFPAKKTPPAPITWQMRAPEDHPELESIGGTLRGLLPEGTRWEAWRHAAGELLGRSVHLGPLRAEITENYTSVDPEPHPLDRRGTSAPHYLRADPRLHERTSDWLREHVDGWELQLDRANDVFSLWAQRTELQRANLAHSGQGLQQLLPVVVHQLMRQDETYDRGTFLDIVEQPELHLHDAAQAPLADLFIDTARRGFGQTIVESHSEPLLLRTQRRVAEGRIAADQIAIYFVDEDPTCPTGGSRIREIPIHPNGDLEWWPRGVFQEDFREVAALHRAQRTQSQATDPDPEGR